MEIKSFQTFTTTFSRSFPIRKYKADKSVQIFMKFLMAFFRKASIESSNDSSREITQSRKIYRFGLQTLKLRARFIGLRNWQSHEQLN